jgi:hypothetical protein
MTKFTTTFYCLDNKKLSEFAISADDTKIALKMIMLILEAQTARFPTNWHRIEIAGD